MKIILEPRRSGKTTKLINMSAETGAYIVCHTKADTDRVWDIAQKMGKNIPYPISASDFLSRRYHPEGVRSLLIDNADLILQAISQVPIDAISLTYSSEYLMDISSVFQIENSPSSSRE